MMNEEGHKPTLRGLRASSSRPLSPVLSVSLPVFIIPHSSFIIHHSPPPVLPHSLDATT